MQLFPVAFESGKGCTLTDVDGNVYIDFSSGIYVTGLGHCHPKVTEAVQRAAGELMNAHDFTTPIKMRLLEKLAEITPGEGAKKLTGMQLYDSGTTAVEAGLRLMRAATGKFEFISFHRDFHGKTMGAVGLARMDVSQGLRAPGFFLVPRGYCYRCEFRQKYPECGLLCVDYIRTVIKEETSGRVAGIVLEPIQGWAGSVVPPDGWIQKIRALCDEYGILMMADEVLTCMGAHRQDVRDGELGHRARRDDPGQGLRQRLPGHRDAGGREVQGCDREDQRQHLLRRQPDGVRRGAGQHRGDRGGEPLRALGAPGRDPAGAHEADGGELAHHRRRARDGLPAGHRAGEGQGHTEPFDEAGKLVYQKAFRKGLAWIPAGHILRMSPPMIMEDDVALKAMDIIEESIHETARELGYGA